MDAEALLPVTSDGLGKWSKLGLSVQGLNQSLATTRSYEQVLSCALSPDDIGGAPPTPQIGLGGVRSRGYPTVHNRPGH